VEVNDFNGETKEGQLETITNALDQKVIEPAEKLRNLTESIKTLTARLLNYYTTESLDKQISVSQAKEFTKTMESHIASIKSDSHRHVITD